MDPASLYKTISLDELDLQTGEFSCLTMNIESNVHSVDEGYTKFLVLTNRRIIQIERDSPVEIFPFVWLQDIASVDIVDRGSGVLRGCFWGLLSVLVAFMVWFSWESVVGSIMVPICILLMGLWLAIEGRSTTPSIQMKFTLGLIEINFDIDSGTTVDEARQFVSKLLELKDEGHIRYFIPK